MKKIIVPVMTVLLLTAYSCKKSTDGNKNVVIADSMSQNSLTEGSINEHTDRYVAEDGSSTLVTFTNEDGKKSISIASNKMTIKAPETEVANVYADHDYTIAAKNDSVTITQGNNVIQLKKARGN